MSSSYVDNKNRQVSKQEQNKKAEDAFDSLAGIIDDVTDEVIDIVNKFNPAIGEILEDTKESFESIIARLDRPNGSIVEEAENASMIQENSKNFATPYKSQEQLEKLHLKQLVTTWEAIRDGEYSYLLNSNGSPGGVGSSGKYSGTNQEIVWQFLTNAGYSKETAAGIMGNIHHESGFDTNAIEHGTGAGFGLIQWTATRRTAIENYAAKNNKDLSDIHFQLEYMQMELEDSSNWIYNPGYSFYPYEYPFNKWKTSNNIEWATEGFCWCFERPAEAVAAIGKRKAKALEYYNEFKDADFKKNSLYNGNASGLAKALIDEARKYLGKGYSNYVRYGPTYDCSSLMQTVIKNVMGLDIGSTTFEQVAKFQRNPSMGRKLSIKEAKPGDLFYYNYGGSQPQHVSLYIGNNRIIHAATPALGIIEQNLMGKEDYVYRLAELG